MQPRFTVGILVVLQAERLVCAIRYLGFTLQFAPTVIIAEPNEIAVLISHLSWNADLVAVEVVGLLVVRDNTPLRSGRADSPPVVRLILLALKTKAGLRLRRTSRNYLNFSNNFFLNSANSSDRLFLSSV